MKKFLAWLLGWREFQVAGETPAAFLNLCAGAGVPLLKMLPQAGGTLLVRTTLWQSLTLEALAREASYPLTQVGAGGVPVFLRRFRRRYALWAGLALAVVLFAVGSRTVLTIDVVGCENLPKEAVLAQLRLCGVSVGTYAPGVEVRQVENRMLRTMDSLTFCAVNLQGTRVEVVVREREDPPDLRPEDQPGDVVSAADGVITHIEPWAGDAQVQVGDAVLEGEVLIAGAMELDPTPPLEGSLGTKLVHAEGLVMAQTWRTFTAEIPLTAQEKVYTGEEWVRCTLSLGGKRVKIFGKSGIPAENYDTMTEQKVCTPLPGKALPVIWEKETCRAYTLEETTLDRAQAEEMLRTRLLADLDQALDQGEVLRTDWAVEEEDGMLRVTLLAQCREQIGREVPLTQQTKENTPLDQGEEGAP